MECVKSTSLVIMPPPQFWPDFVDIKKNHMNPKIKRPPYPHITLFVGFLSQHLPISLSPFAHTRHFEEARSKLQILLKNVKPFRINIRTFKLFENGPSCTLYLEPEISPPNALDALYKQLKGAFPEVPESDFEAHIGVGYFRDLTKGRNLQKTYQKNWKPMDWVCNEIYIMSRLDEETPFECRVVIPFQGKDKSQSPWKEVPLDSEWSQCMQYQTREGGLENAPLVQRSQPQQEEIAEEEPEKPVAEAPHVVPYDWDQDARALKIAKRVIQWLFKEYNKWNVLPKSQDKLANSIKPFCTVKVPILPVEYIVDRLKSEGYIYVDDEETLTFRKKVFEGFPSKLTGSHWSHGLEEKQIAILVRIFKWTLTQNHSSLDALELSISNMSTEKFTVPPTVVVAKLIEMKAIEILKNKKVEYMIFAECEEEWCEEEGGEGF